MSTTSARWGTRTAAHKMYRERRRDGRGNEGKPENLPAVAPATIGAGRETDPTRSIRVRTTSGSSTPTPTTTSSRRSVSLLRSRAKRMRSTFLSTSVSTPTPLRLRPRMLPGRPRSRLRRRRARCSPGRSLPGRGRHGRLRRLVPLVPRHSFQVLPWRLRTIRSAVSREIAARMRDNPLIPNTSCSTFSPGRAAFGSFVLLSRRRGRGGAYRGRPSTRVAVYKPYPPQPPARRPAEQPHSRSKPPRSCVALPVFVLAPARRSVPRRGGCSLLGSSILPGFSFCAPFCGARWFCPASGWSRASWFCLCRGPGPARFVRLPSWIGIPIGPVFRSISTSRTTVCREPVPIVLRGCDLIDVSTLFRFGIVLRRIRRPVVREGTSWLLGCSGGREILSVSVPVAVRAVSPPS